MTAHRRCLLNCDLGESFGAWRMGSDEQVMPFVDQASIACGFHAGDPMIINKTLLLAQQHCVSVGAHPSYPDIAGFGRRSMTLPTGELIAIMQYQIAALDGMAANLGIQLDYVKPHGALYNDMMIDATIRAAAMRAVAEHHRPLAFMMQATGDAESHRREADAAGLEVLFEGFADRCYDDQGRLVARSRAGAVHGRDQMLAQVTQLLEHNCVTTASGRRLPLQIDSLCVHGDNLAAVEAIADIRRLIEP